ncbi:hypothetical protein A2875_00645 [Candidatus Gottesmanbacteria bacterium RIFCSPHIGHO2_01_FULL_46_14]|uniref:Glycosyltransferase 2-like domain-containing protein n=1 Tax=Candidatus Gottesmanbacteria bacterium RIFCSPHIGHO2_01_FULL_46_14 TaxID=1798380 RepID=A0A1F5ZS16_9BACT|nr:MAG: hypothetical protein A2875_00645 [Candidatus Gottesmanbacteria bacterium RIFCSPHIGHO2_01_FULL_46_14]
MPKPLLTIVIPCLNERDTIALVIKDARKHAQKYFPGQSEVIVADNGSTDGTKQILKKIRSIKVVHVPIRGYGAALHWGISKAAGKYILFGDADLSYPFSNLGKFKSLLSLNPDLILGSRLTGHIQKGAMPPLHRYLGTPVLTWIIRLLYHIPTTDCNSGMRLVKKGFYQKLNMRNSGMEWASELLLKTALKKGKYLETPIRFLKDQRRHPPHLSTWSDGWRHLKSIILLKASSLFVFFFFFVFLAAIVYPISYSLTSYSILLACVTFLSYLALRFLEFAIERKHNSVSTILNSNRLVIWVAQLSFVIGGSILLIPDSRLGTKLLLVSFNALLFIWVFLIETIKTHLVNRLPDADV